MPIASGVSCTTCSCSRASYAPALAAQPFPVEQMGAGSLRRKATAPEPVDRLAVELIRDRAVAEEARARAGLDAETDSVPSAACVR